VDNAVDNMESEDSEKSTCHSEMVRARTVFLKLPLTSWFETPLSEGVPHTPPSLACVLVDTTATAVGTASNNPAQDSPERSCLWWSGCLDCMRIENFAVRNNMYSSFGGREGFCHQTWACQSNSSVKVHSTGHHMPAGLPVHGQLWLPSFLAASYRRSGGDFTIIRSR
jgi:hypothetical protein